MNGFSTFAAGNSSSRATSNDFFARALSFEELKFVSGGGAGDVGACIGGAVAIGATQGLATVGLGIATIGACIGAVDSMAPADGSTANCVGTNACVDGSVDGSDGNGSASSSDGGGSTGGDGGSE
jgi:hypothetical protein